MYRFVTAIRERRMMDFKQIFRAVDVLMVDDVQFIAGKDSTQEEFFHTFNALVDAGRQIILSADRAPGEIRALEERIRSRLQSGLVVDVHPTDYELRLGVLQAKAGAYASHYPDTVIAPGVSTETAPIVSTTCKSRSVAMTLSAPCDDASISTFDRIGMVLRRSTTDWTWDRQRSRVARSIVAFMVASCPLHRQGIRSPSPERGPSSLTPRTDAASESIAP